MISAFKHIRLSGYNLIPTTGNNSIARLNFATSGLAYYNELTGISGHLQSLIDTANADVSSINGQQGALNFQGTDGIQILWDSQNNTFLVSGKDTAVQASLTTLTNNLATTGLTLDTKINTLSGYTNDTFATKTNLATTGSDLDTKINTLSGYADSTYVGKSNQRVFSVTLTPGSDSYTINYPVAYNGAPSPRVQATLETAGDVMYHISVRSINTTSFVLDLSDVLVEENTKVHVYASRDI